MTDSNPRRYFGWIPNVSGRLSFSEFGNTDNPTPCIRCRFSDSSSRTIIAYQKRHLSDTVLPIISCFRPLKILFDYYLLRKEGVFWFAATVKQDKNPDCLSGTVFVFYRDQWRNYSEAQVKDAMSTLISCASQGKSYEIVEGLETALVNHSSILVNFSILRSGEVEIIFDPKSQGKGYIPADSTDVIDDVISQVYYFLKDCLHNHQHHSKETDSILQIYPENSEQNWKVETLYTLYRKIISRRRSATLVDLNESLGVLAYASSFEKLFQKELMHHESIIKYNKDELKDSINAAIYASENKKSGFNLVISDTFKTTITIAAFLISVIMMTSLSDYRVKSEDIDEYIFVALTMTLKHPLVSIPLLYFFIFPFIHYKNYNTSYQCVFDDAVRLLVAGRRTTHLVFISLSIILYVLWVYILILIYSSS